MLILVARESRCSGHVYKDKYRHAMDRNVRHTTFFPNRTSLFSIIALAKLSLTYRVGLRPINESQPVAFKAPFTLQRLVVLFPTEPSNL